MRREGLSQTDASRAVEETDPGRRDFVLSYSQKDIDGPHLYDPVINVEQIVAVVSR